MLPTPPRYPVVILPWAHRLLCLTSRAPIETSVDRRATAIEPIVNPIAATIKVLVDAIATCFKMVFDAIPASVELLCTQRMAIRSRPLGPVVQARIDAITLRVEVLINPITARIQMLLDPISIIQTFYGAAERISRARGRDPDRPRLLSKVTKTL